MVYVFKMSLRTLCLICSSQKILSQLNRTNEICLHFNESIKDSKLFYINNYYNMIFITFY